MFRLEENRGQISCTKLCTVNYGKFDPFYNLAAIVLEIKGYGQKQCAGIKIKLYVVKNNNYDKNQFLISSIYQILIIF